MSVESRLDELVAAPAAAPSRAAAPARFDNVNLLRAFAALAVVVYHVIEHSKWTAYPTEGPLVTFRIGWIGVDLFFVISGFVITYSALALWRAEPAAFQRRYWARRISRIVPLYVLTMAAWIVLVAPAHSPREWAWQLFAHLTFIHGFFPSTHSSIDGVNWTLAIEMQFYLAVALLVRWIDRTPGWRVVLWAFAISWAWRASMFVIYGHGDTFPLWMHVTQLPGTLDEFAAGILLAKSVLDGRDARQPVRWLVAAGATGYAAMAIFWARAEYWNDAAMVIFWRSSAAVFLFCVVAAAVQLPQAIARRWLKPVDYLGEISYGIYLWHLFAVQLVILELGMARGEALVAVVAITLLLSAASWRYFERPIMRLAR